MGQSRCLKELCQELCRNLREQRDEHSQHQHCRPPRFFPPPDKSVALGLTVRVGNISLANGENNKKRRDRDNNCRCTSSLALACQASARFGRFWYTPGQNSYIINFQNGELCNVTVLVELRVCVCLSLLSSHISLFSFLSLFISVSLRLSPCVCFRVMLCCVGVVLCRVVVFTVCVVCGVALLFWCVRGVVICVLLLLLFVRVCGTLKTAACRSQQPPCVDSKRPRV